MAFGVLKGIHKAMTESSRCLRSLGANLRSGAPTQTLNPTPLSPPKEGVYRAHK